MAEIGFIKKKLQLACNEEFFKLKVNFTILLHNKKCTQIVFAISINLFHQLKAKEKKWKKSKNIDDGIPNKCVSIKSFRALMKAAALRQNVPIFDLLRKCVLMKVLVTGNGKREFCCTNLGLVPNQSQKH